MATYDNTNRGTLFVNERKSKDTQPDWSGSLNVDGVEFFLDAWAKTSQSGRDFFSVSVKRKDKQAGSAQNQPRQQEQASRQPQAAPRTHGQMKRASAPQLSSAVDDDSEIPF